VRNTVEALEIGGKRIARMALPKLCRLVVILAYGAKSPAFWVPTLWSDRLKGFCRKLLNQERRLTMTIRMLKFVRVVFNWLFWVIAKLLLVKGDLFTGLTLEAASRLLGCLHQGHERVALRV
jgi:hypothetical protein